MQYKKVEEKDIEECLRKYFSTDKELIEKWHIAAGKDVETCVQRTLKDLKNNTANTFVLFELEDNSGFFGIEDNNFLTTFFIHPKNRTKESLHSIWSIINSKLDVNFKSSLFTKNTPAIKFFLRNGGQVIATGKYKEENFLVFEFNRR